MATAGRTFGLSSNALFTKNRGVGTIWNDD
jgi:hypothetical protein